jgi:phosphoglycerate kinase
MFVFLLTCYNKNAIRRIIQMAKKLVTDLDVTGKKVIVRVDFNVPLKSGEITDDNRIVAALPTIKYLVDNKAKVILLSHLGKIDYKKTDEEIAAAKKKNNMAPVAKRLQEKLPETKVVFVDATRGPELEKAVNELQDGEVLLMQNTRYEKGESKNDEELGKYWASLGELYVSDAFGSVHRAHASTVGIPTYLPSAVGFLIEKELKFLGDAVENPVRPFVGILGGAKVADKLAVISNLLEKCDTLIIGGGMAYTFLKAEGKEVGKSLVDDTKLDYCKEMMEKAEKLGKKLLLPIDTVVAASFPDPIDGPVETEVVSSDAIPSDKEGLDIGPKTAELFANEVKNAKTVVWNGPMGVFENPTLAAGTNAVAKALSECEGTTIIGGGDSAAAIKQLGYADKVSHVSTGGGASLEFLEGKGLPGVDVIEEK